MTKLFSFIQQVHDRMWGQTKFLRSILLGLATIACLHSSRAVAEVPVFAPLQPQVQTPTPAALPASASQSNHRVQQATHREDSDNRVAVQPLESPLKITLPRSEFEKSSARPGPLSAIFTVLGSLAVVLGLFIGIAWLMRRGLPNSAGRLPTGVIETLGHAPLAARRQMHVLRFGDKLLLVCVSQNSVDTLAEIADPAEVVRLTNLCQKNPPAAAATFDQAFGKLMRSPHAEQTVASGGLAAMALRKKSPATEASHG